MTHTTQTTAPREADETRTEYVIKWSAAKMPSSCWGSYRRVAVIEVDPDLLPEGAFEPLMISERARGVVRILRTWEKLNVGSTDRCAFERALQEAEQYVAELERDRS